MEKTNKKNKKRIIAAVIVLALAAAGGGGYYYYSNDGGISSEEVYVTSVATLTGALENGMQNRYAGIVESQETWSAKNKDAREIKEFYVKVGDPVAKDQELFVYDTAESEESLAEAETDLERSRNELTTYNDDLAELNTEKAETSDPSASAELTVEIQQKQMDIQSKSYEITSKENEIQRLQDTIDQATVVSGIDGVVKSIADGESDMDSNDAITIVNTENFQIKARVNEQNLTEITETMPVIVFSRMSDDVYWKGTVSKLDTDSTITAGNDYYEGGDTMTDSTNYPFYITLEDTTGLSMGQHVYVEADIGQLEDNGKTKIELEEYMIEDADGDAPYVWADNGSGRLEKRSVTLGKYDEESMKYVIKSGLSLSDKLAQPDEDLTEGMKTIDASEETDEETDGQDEDEDEDDTEDEDFDDESDELIDEDALDEEISEDDIEEPETEEIP